MKKLFGFVCVLCFGVASFAQADIDVYPINWWVGMKNPNLQLMVHGKNIGNQIPMMKLPATGLKLDQGITLKGMHAAENPNYVFLDLVIDKAAKPGLKTFSFPGGKAKFTYELKARRQGKGTSYAQGVTSSDFIYLLMPDRFSNGDPSNDKIAGYRDQSLNRDSIFHRHGGDLQGVVNHLDYLQNMGVTTLWMTPVQENDMPNRTEHGYAITNHYKVDRRLGDEELYRKLSNEVHRRGMKLIQDAVYNHCGLYNFFIQDMPMKDWVHQWPKYTNTTYKDGPLMDIHASKKDAKVMSDGWFTTQMPDLNQNNPFVANFLIQNAIWSVEEFGVDGWRIDTYIYNDLPFMNRCNQALIDEYPKMTMFGETWVHGMLNQAYFTENNLTNIKFKNNIPEKVVNGYEFLGDTTESLFHETKEAVLPPNVWYEEVANKNVVYNNYSTGRTISQKPVAEETFLVEDSLVNIRWKLTNDTRNIAGYDCRKAIGFVDDTLAIFAFYTDELLVRGGPESVHGLPGMILGMGVPRLYATWFATTVEVNGVNTAAIKPAVKGKKVSRLQLINQLDAVMKNWGKYGSSMRLNFLL